MLLLIFGRRTKDLTDFQLALQHISYVGVWSIWQEESPIARVQTHWPEAPVFIRTRRERLQGRPPWGNRKPQPRWRGSPERGWEEANPARWFLEKTRAILVACSHGGITADGNSTGMLLQLFNKEGDFAVRIKLIRACLSPVSVTSVGELGSRVRELHSYLQCWGCFLSKSRALPEAGETMGNGPVAALAVAVLFIREMSSVRPH